jgi:hypothetical protein
MARIHALKRGFQWLLSMRQDDGGWAIPLRTTGLVSFTGVLQKATIQPNRAKPFSHLVIGIVLRAFAAHAKYRSSKEAKEAGGLLASRFFRRYAYPHRQNGEFWLKPFIMLLRK